MEQKSQLGSDDGSVDASELGSVSTSDVGSEVCCELVSVDWDSISIISFFQCLFNPNLSVKDQTGLANTSSSLLLLTFFCIFLFLCFESNDILQLYYQYDPQMNY